MRTQQRHFAHVAVLSIVSLVGCQSAPQGVDGTELFLRSDLNYYGPCSSWLVSQASGQRYCASPPVTVASSVKDEGPAKPQVGETKAGETKAGETKAGETKVDKASLMEAGETIYGRVCVACHQADGKGMPGLFPPLAGASEFYGTPQNMAKIVVGGLAGKIEVLGESYDAVMPPQGAMLSDYEVAAVTTFVRHSWGNNDGVVTPEMVKSVR